MVDVMGYVLATLAAARQALFELPPAAVGLLLLAGVLLAVASAAVGALVVFDVIDEGPPPRHCLRRGGLRVDSLCPTMSYCSPSAGREASTDHRLTSRRVRPPVRPRWSPAHRRSRT